MTRAPHSAVAIDAALERGDAALIAYLPVGFPSVEDSIRAGKVLADVGVDAIELGFPYSDPGHGRPHRSSARLSPPWSVARTWRTCSTPWMS